MKKSVLALSVLSLGLAHTLQAQTLFTVGKEAIDKKEFLKVYSKNANNQQVDYSQKAVNEYIDLYSLFKMKVAEAKALKIDTIPAVKTELENYKFQLANTYLTDKSATETLAKEAYDRYTQDVDVSHILIFASPNADSTAAYAKIDSLYQQINAGKITFEKAAEVYSEDRSSSVNGGNIGYISAFNVVYPFENAAYNTPVGQISKPFRSQFGFHIVKVHSRKKSEGEYKVQQILLKKPNTPEERNAVLATAADIKASLQKGATFDDMVIKYSTDKFSKNNKGYIEPFRLGKNVKVFDEAVLKLKKAGDISEPIETAYGIHIIKLIEKKPIESYDAVRTSMIKQSENDDRILVAKSALEEKVKKQYKYTEQKDNLKPIIAKLEADTALKNNFKMDAFQGLDKTLFSFDGKNYTQKDFLQYATNITRGKLYGNNPSNIIGDLFKMYQEKTIREVQVDHLSKNNEDFKTLLKEYNDGILLFEYMEREVWNKASQDTLGLRQYYERNANKYVWQPSFEGRVFQSGNGEVLKKFRERILKGEDVMDVYNDITKNTQELAGVSMDVGRYEMNKFNTTTADFVEGKPTSIFLNANNYTMVVPNKVYSTATTKTLEEARGYIIADYQEYLDKELNNALKKKYPIKVEEKVLKTIVK